jgi:dihydrodipicolinate synthase/N-acetylneuraminate lyase
MDSDSTGLLAGVFPVAPTPFTASGELDLAGQRRGMDCMIDQGVDGICILANYSEQFLLTDLIRPVVVHHRAGRRTDAAAQDARILPLINYENRQCGLRAANTVLREGGVIASDHVRHPLEPLHSATRAGLLALAREADPLALRWGR